MDDCKPCTQCGDVKPFAAFAADRRSKSGRQAACSQCQRRLYNNADKKAEYRRRAGEVTSPYRTQAEIAADAATRRVAAQRVRYEVEQTREVHLAAGRQAMMVHQIGSDAWISQATADQIASFKRVQSGKAVVRSGVTRQIRLRGQYAIGAFAFTTVDAEDYDSLSPWFWKAKPNGEFTGIYAVRNVVIGGRCRTIRMHREVLGIGFDEGLHVDHIDRDPLNNRLSNLRLVTRSQNLRNSTRSDQARLRGKSERKHSDMHQ